MTPSGWRLYGGSPAVRRVDPTVLVYSSGSFGEGAPQPNQDFLLGFLTHVAVPVRQH